MGCYPFLVLDCVILALSFSGSVQFCAVSVWTGGRDCVSEVLSVLRASSKRVFCSHIQPGSPGVEQEGREGAVSCLLAGSSLAALVVGDLWKQAPFQFP